MPVSQQQSLVTASVFININELHDTTQEGFFSSHKNEIVLTLY